MLVAAPIPLTLNSTTVADTTYSAYNAGTTYALGDKVSATVDSEYGTDWTHEYESLAADNTGNPVTDTDWWLDLGPTNRHKMFDAKTGTRTTATNTMTVSVSPGQYFDLIALVRIEEVQQVEITVTRGVETLYDITVDTTQQSANWWEYYFGPIGAIRSSVIVRPEVFYSDATVTVTMTGSGTIGCGLLMVARASELGETLQGTSVSIEDYSTKETDQFGDTYLLERDYADRASAQVVLNSQQVDYVKRTLAEYRATPALYNLNNTDTDYESLIVFGKYDSFSVDMQYYNQAYCSLEVVSIL